MRVALAQLNFTVGSFGANAQKIEAYLRDAARQGADILVTPELALSGYAAQDFLQNPDFLRAHDRALQELIQATKDISTRLVLGCLEPRREGRGKPLYNSALVIHRGEVIDRRQKSLLPAGDIFDEPRYFSSAANNDVLVLGKKRISLMICEDLWGNSTAHDQRYALTPLDMQLDNVPNLVLSLNASPYHTRKHAARLKMVSEAVQRVRAPVVYVNQVNAVDHVLFDGRSFVMNEAGDCVLELPAFEEMLAVIDTEHLPKKIQPSTENLETLKKALCFGIREYIQKTNQKGVVLGLSGGVDSALVLALAVEALGAKRVHALALPGPFNSPASEEDARTLARALGVTFHVLSIQESLQASAHALGAVVPHLENSVAYENLQARCRAQLLMGYANAHQLVVLGTSNKSEVAVGYCTLYGDAIGAFAPIGDVLKTDVYALCQHLQKTQKMFPERILTRAPSAELRPNQTDQDSLPPYAVLDQLIELLVVQRKPLEEVAQLMKTSLDFVQEWAMKIDGAEFKRRQLPFPLRVSPRGFDFGRRHPIVHQKRSTWI